MIDIRGIDHVALRVADLDEAVARWSVQFGLTPSVVDGGHAYLRCGYEPYSVELIAGEPGHDHTGFELRRGCELEMPPRTWTRRGSPTSCATDSLHLADLGRQPASSWCRSGPGRRPTCAPTSPATSAGLPGYRPRKLGHVNFLTGRIHEQARFYTWCWA